MCRGVHMTHRHTHFLGFVHAILRKIWGGVAGACKETNLWKTRKRNPSTVPLNSECRFKALHNLDNRFFMGDEPQRSYKFLRCIQIVWKLDSVQKDELFWHGNESICGLSMIFCFGTPCGCFKFRRLIGEALLSLCLPFFLSFALPLCARAHSPISPMAWFCGLWWLERQPIPGAIEAH